MKAKHLLFCLTALFSAASFANTFFCPQTIECKKDPHGWMNCKPNERLPIHVTANNDDNEKIPQGTYSFTLAYINNFPAPFKQECLYTKSGWRFGIGFSKNVTIPPSSPNWKKTQIQPGVRFECHGEHATDCPFELI